MTWRNWEGWAQPQCPEGARLGTPTSQGRGRPRESQILVAWSLVAEPALPSLRSLLVMGCVWRSSFRKEITPVPRAMFFNFVNPNYTFNCKLNVQSPFPIRDL